MKRYGWMVGLAVLVAVLSLCYVLGTAKPESLYPYNGGLRYPQVPREFYIRRGDKKPMRPPLVAKSRAEIVEWADANRMSLVQNVGPYAFLVSNDIGSGASIWVLLLYFQHASRWHLLYVGNGGLQHQAFQAAAFYDSDKKAVLFFGQDGKLLSTLKIGKEVNLLYEKR